MGKITYYKLSAKSVAAIKDKGQFLDGDGLYLQVTDTGTKSWIYRFRLEGKHKEMGLGSVRDVPLKEARELRDKYKKLVKAGRNPILERKIEKIESSEIPKFRDFALKMIEEWKSDWRNPKHHYQWEMSVTKYAELIGDMRIDHIETEHVLSALKKIWNTKRETAKRTQMRIKRVLDAASVRKFRSGENPARWTGHLEHLLSAYSKSAQVHHPSLSYKVIPEFIKALRALNSVSAAALEVTILTALRTSEVILATPQEIDIKEKVWTIPAERMKMKKAHQVPLSDRVIEVLEEALRAKAKYLFLGGSKNGHLSTAAMRMCLHGINDKISVHGFRSSFRDWAGDKTDFPREVIEAALGHAVGNQVERAYRRGNALEKRRIVMDAWAYWCDNGTMPPL